MYLEKTMKINNLSKHSFYQNLLKKWIKKIMLKLMNKILKISKEEMNKYYTY